MWDTKVAVAYLDKHARSASHGKCAAYVRKAIEAGGVRLHRHASAKDYGENLIAAGFAVVETTILNAGDVVVIQPIAGHSHGHVAMYDGAKWVSDFKQRSGFYPSESYRKFKPAFAIYRHP
ncbi:NlpC/P60 family protein [Rugamonas aquatica]|uniref:CHAP domain-containing protein n=1 Tax=Rugamonas aquatica TaxID=2743357 RepID=A0A6A7NB28_9BURK|nr:NlpC/P60 family protein [Rugamonas aquatica]MQA41727.1 CHAP domain-containing protein [Rugamonas aquatica]